MRETTGAATADLTASLLLRRGAGSRVGAERIALLEAISEQGSIAAAAMTVGLSYKGAWDAVQALNNLFDEPLVAAHAGGRGGGETGLTTRGAAVVRAFAPPKASWPSWPRPWSEISPRPRMSWRRCFGDWA